MADPGKGHLGYLALAPETTYGTAPAAATLQLELIGEPTITPGTRAVVSEAVSPARMAPGAVARGIANNPRISCRFQIGLEGMEEIWRMFLPQYARDAVGGETVVFDHTAKDGPSLKSYTAELSMGDVPAGKVTRMTGSYGMRLVVDFPDSDAFATGSIELIGKTMTPNVTPMTAANYPAANLGPQLHLALNGSGEIADGSGDTVSDILIRSLQIAVNIPHTDYNPAAASAVSLAPVRSGNALWTVGFDRYWNTVAAMLAAQNGTTGALKFLFQLPTTIGNASKRELEFTAAAPTTSEYGATVPVGDYVMQRITHTLAYDSGTDAALKIRNRNLAAALA